MVTTTKILEAFLAGKAERSPYLERQRYAPVLEAYLERFGRERVLILLHEDLSADPRAFVERILAFWALPGSRGRSRCGPSCTSR